MNLTRQQAQKIIFEVLNTELLQLKNDAGSMAWNIVRALGFENEPETVTVRMDNSTGKFIPKPASVFLPGFDIIGQMSREHLIEEIILAQRETLKGNETDALRAIVVQIRLGQVKDRLMKEAGINPNPFGFLFGGGVATDDKSDE